MLTEFGRDVQDRFLRMLSREKGKHVARGWRRFTEEFNREALQMLLEAHWAPSVTSRWRLGICLCRF